MAGMQKENVEIASLSCILFKKYFLDDRRTDGMNASDLEHMKTTVM